MNGTIYVLPRGGFGKLLFNYMIGKSLAKEYGMNLAFVSGYHCGMRKHMKEYDMFKGLTFVDKPSKNSQRICETFYPYSPVVIPDRTKDYVLDGYFQSFRYSSGHMKELKSAILEHPFYSPVSKQYADYSKGMETVLLHVRRGDYLNLPDVHPVLPDEYYRQALEGLKGDFMIIVVSDDIEFVKNWGLLCEYKHIIVDIPDPEKCFILMTMCTHFIIANSSFSLLAFYFRENADAQLFLPDPWFGNSGPKYKLDDMAEMTDKTHVIRYKQTIIRSTSR